METLLITSADFAAFGFDLPAGIEPRLNPHILAAQQTRLANVLGEPLRAELERRYATRLPDPLPDPIPETEYVAPWLELRAACAPLIAAVALGRYLPLGQLTITTHSVTVKDAANSKPADPQQINAAVRVLNDDAVRYERSLRAYLAAGTAPADFAAWLPAATCGSGRTGNHSSTRTRPLRRADDDNRR